MSERRRNEKEEEKRGEKGEKEEECTISAKVGHIMALFVSR